MTNNSDDDRLPIEQHFGTTKSDISSDVDGFEINENNKWQNKCQWKKWNKVTNSTPGVYSKRRKPCIKKSWSEDEKTA